MFAFRLEHRLIGLSDVLLQCHSVAQFSFALALKLLEARKAAVEEQRAWLKARNQKCIIYKGWVDCLADAYNSRIAEVQEKIEERKKLDANHPPAAAAEHNFNR